MRRFIFMVCVLAFLLSGSPHSEAKVYQWTDDNGKTHFTDSPSKVPRKYRSSLPKNPPAKKPAPDFSSGKTPSSSNSFKGSSKLEKEMGKGFQKMGEEFGKVMEKGMEKMGEELGKAFEGIGELMVVAAENSPDEKQRTTFKNATEERVYKTKQVLLSAFLLCQFQYIVIKTKTCKKDGPKEGKNGWKVKKDSEGFKLMKDYDFKIDPKRNSRKNLLIRAYHKKSGPIYEINHHGKKSIKKSSDQTR